MYNKLFSTTNLLGKYVRVVPVFTLSFTYSFVLGYTYMRVCQIKTQLVNKISNPLLSKSLYGDFLMMFGLFFFSLMK